MRKLLALLAVVALATFGLGPRGGAPPNTPGATPPAPPTPPPYAA